MTLRPRARRPGLKTSLGRCFGGQLQLEALEQRQMLSVTPQLEVSGGTVYEDAGSLTFDVWLSTSSNQMVSVQYATEDNSASSIEDFGPTFGTLVFAPGQMLGHVTVPINNDPYYEPQESFGLRLSNASNATIADDFAAGTIVDDEPQPVISFANTQVFRTEDAFSVSLIVNLSTPSQLPVFVNYTTENGSASSPSDYAPAIQSVFFSPGNTQQVITISLFDDDLDEYDETFNVSLFDPLNAVIAGGNATVTILDNDAPVSVSISDAHHVEGYAEMPFDVTLSRASSVPVFVNYSTQSGTATSGQDFLPRSGSLFFAPGVTQQSLFFGITDDQLWEDDETFTVVLSNPSGASLLRATGIGTILDNEAPLKLGVSNVTATEDQGFVVFDLYLSAPAPFPVVVQASTQSGTATAGSDYFPLSTLVTFNTNDVVKSVTVIVAQDLVAESDESFTLNLSNVSGAELFDSSGTATIENDDPQQWLTVSDVALSAAGAAPGGGFTVTLSSPSSQFVTVHYSTLNGTASANDDYSPTFGVITFAPGQTTFNVPVMFSPASPGEGEETFSLVLTNPVGALLADDRGTATIYAEPAVPHVSISNPQIVQRESSGMFPVARFTLTLWPPSNSPVAVGYHTQDFSATTVDNDYEGLMGALTFMPGQTVQLIDVPVIGDTRYEPDETFGLVLSGASGATIGNSLGFATLLNDDPNVIVSFKNVNALAAENLMSVFGMPFRLGLSAPSQQPVTVTLSSHSGTAIAGVDFQQTLLNVVFSPGQTETTFFLPGFDDGLGEGDETFWLEITSSIGASTGDGWATGTIVDDDPPTIVSIENPQQTIVEGSGGVKFALFTVRLSAPQPQAVVVEYATSDSSATQTDYMAQAGTLTFSPFQTLAFLTVPVISDFLNEADESFSLNLFNATGAVLGNSQAAATIVDDDPLPRLTVSDLTVVEGGLAAFIVNLAAPLSSPDPVVVSYAVQNGTAGEFLDYMPQVGTLTFFSGTTSQLIFVPTFSDFVREGDETFSLLLYDPQGAALEKALGTATILDADKLPSLSISDIDQPEGTGFQQSRVFMVQLSAPVPYPVSVSVDTRAGSASVGFDYLGTFGGLSFAPFETLKFVTVLVNGDSESEPDETFILRLSYAQGAIIARDMALGVIRNDDGGSSELVPPFVDLSASAPGEGYNGFWNDTGSVAITNFDAVVSDADGTTLTSLTVTIVNSEAHDVLLFDTSGTNLMGAYANGVLTLSTGSANIGTLAEYAQVLRTVRYDNTASGPGAFVRTIQVVANDGMLDSNTAVATIEVPHSFIQSGSRKIFYNNSKWDGNGNNGGGIGVSDDLAIATDKSAYLPGNGTSTFANMTSYDKGINGVMIDLAGPHAATLTADDFIFRVGNNNTPTSWLAAPAPANISIRTGAGTLGSDRVEIVWADGAIKNTWLQVTVKSGGNTGLSDLQNGYPAGVGDVFFFGNKVGNVPGTPGADSTNFAVVGANDQLEARGHLGLGATRANVYDFDRNKIVDSNDELIARGNGGNLRFINVANPPLVPEVGPAPAALVALSAVVGDGGESMEVDEGIASALAVTTFVDIDRSPATPPNWRIAQVMPSRQAHISAALPQTSLDEDVEPINFSLLSEEPCEVTIADSLLADLFSRQ